MTKATMAPPYKICTFVEGKEKLLVPKVNNLLKHVGHRKCMVSMPAIDASFYNLNKGFMHATNEFFFAIHDCLFILDHLLVDVPTNCKWKFDYLRKFEAFLVVVESEGVFTKALV
jgi:hypothetical protein